MSEPKGGYAFPVGDNSCGPMNAGMSLRDYFAGQIVAGIMANGSMFEAMRSVKGSAMRDGVIASTFEEEVEFPSYAHAAYKIADAMLKERAAQ